MERSRLQSCVPAKVAERGLAGIGQILEHYALRHGDGTPFGGPPDLAPVA
jgi:hypothetical protein